MDRIGYGVAFIENVVLNQEREDKRISRMFCLEPGKEGYKDKQDPVNPFILFFLVQNKLSLSFLVQDTSV